ncbi:hypothetical protein RM574_20295 [Streptomyces sp. DSM 41982]|uniref:Uncharacterized protein n=1 Tax=Streptomyces evansiae TaxID=3075535 RepID=A0ABD5EC68_9ACTN|nr:MULTISPECIES: hypothetical protein [unclassified Streptomyces]MDT0417825.1 hypothetical protein [Streptomyces sp. DSM 41982]SCE11242.1 hypothetical protein GA0115246_1109010 [Streptomyces sp. SolWspMP-sol7th]
MSGIRLKDLSAALGALQLLTLNHPELPAPCADVSTVFPDRLRLAFHESLADFEAWREALGVASEAVELRLWGRASGSLRGSVAYAGATVELIGFLQLATLEEPSEEAAG